MKILMKWKVNKLWNYEVWKCESVKNECVWKIWKMKRNEDNEEMIVIGCPRCQSGDSFKGSKF